jgi:hypothetical protein
MSYRETFRMNQRDFDEEKQDQKVMKEKLELSSHATSNTTIISGRPWYHRLYQMLANPFRWIFLGYIKYQ